MLKLDNILLLVLIIVCTLISATLVAAVVGDDFILEIVQAAGIISQHTENTEIREDLGDKDIDEDWQVFRSDGYAFEIRYPGMVTSKDIPNQSALSAGIEVPENTPVWEFILEDPDLFNETNLIDASLVIHISRGENSIAACSEYKSGSRYKYRGDPLPVVEINGNHFWKDIIEEGVMGGTYQRISYRAVSQYACYELTQIIHFNNMEAFPPGAVQAFDGEETFRQLDQVLETFKLLDIAASFPPQSYPEPKSVDEEVDKSSTIHVDGLDVSHWQGDINWTKVAKNDYIFTFAKGTEGVGWTDSKFLTNITQGTTAGVYMGVYHFARPDLDNTGQEEAEYFLSVVGDYLESGYLRPVLDLEVGSYLGKNALSAWVLDWLQTVESQSGVAPLIYTNYNYVSNFLTDPVADYDLWIAYWNCDPTPTFNIPPTGMWGDWGFWQYCVRSAGYVPGIQTPIDVNIFNGVEEGLAEFDAASSPLWVSLTNYTHTAPSPHYADLTAVVNGDASGPIDFSFWWDCASLEVDITAVSASCGALPTPADPTEGECLENEYGIRCSALAEKVKMVEHTYQEIGNYTAKVIVERGDVSPAEDRYQISVYNPILSLTTDPLNPGQAAVSELFNFQVLVNIDSSVSGALQVEVIDDNSGMIEDQGCQGIAHDVRVTKTFDLAVIESEVGLKDYSIWARYRPRQDCPVVDNSADDQLSAYQINWLTPEMDVTGNGQAIPNGSTETSIINGTDFDEIYFTGGSVTHSFIIGNDGGVDLTLNGDPLVSISGLHASDFFVAEQPISPVPAGGGTTSFEVTFNPIEPGVRTAVVSIPNNNINADPYTFTIQGTGAVFTGHTTADFDGDGDTDISVYNETTGRWNIFNQSSTNWGFPGDLPVPGDYNGNGETDIAIFRPSTGKWFIKDQGILSWYHPGDIPVQADYDGDGAVNIAVLRPSTGRWYIHELGNFKLYAEGDIPVPCDYNGDGAAEIAVFRPSNNQWYIFGQDPITWAQTGDIPVPADYDGDGSCDIAVYRPSNGNWFVQGQGMTSWGFTDDIPVPGDYDGDGAAEIAVLRPSNGKWYIQGLGNFSWYASGDYPLPVRDTNADGDPYH